MFYEHIAGTPLFYQIGRTTVYSRSLRKIVGLLGNPAFLATVLAMVAPIMTHRFLRARTPYAGAFWGGMAALAIAGNYFCYNRGGWLALAMALLVMFLLNREYRRLFLPFVLVGALVLALYWGAVSGSNVVTERLSNLNSILFRVNMLEVSRRMILANPLFGVGFGNFAAYYTQYGGYWELLAWDIPTPHNTYVLVLATMGLVTLIPYVLVFVSMILEMLSMLRRSRRKSGADSALLVAGCASVVAYCVAAAALDIYVNAFTAYILFAIGGTILGYVSARRSSGPQIPESGA